MHPPRILRDVRSKATLAMVGKAPSSSLIVEESAHQMELDSYSIVPPAGRDSHAKTTNTLLTIAARDVTPNAGYFQLAHHQSYHLWPSTCTMIGSRFLVLSSDKTSMSQVIPPCSSGHGNCCAYLINILEIILYFRRGCIKWDIDSRVSHEF